MTNKIITPEQEDAVYLHLLTYHDVESAYYFDDISNKMKNIYRGMLPQSLHNFVHRHNHFPKTAIEHEHSTELLEAYATVADGKLKELKELANQ